jgi:hypothetical protein
LIFSGWFGLLDPGPSDEDDGMVSSNLVMSDRRVPRRVRRESDDLWAR